MRNIFKSKLNIVFIIELIFFGLIITGLLPRETAIFLAIGLAIYMATAPIEDATVFFVRSIPFFIAIPITANYDNLNVWRILSIILFLKLAHVTGLQYFLKIKEFAKHSKLLVILLVFAVLSIIPALDKGAAITRIIFFVNLSLVGIVVYYLSQKSTEFTERLIKNITTPAMIVVTVGFIQVASTYFIDIYQFMRIWGEGIQMRQFGVLWSEIAVRLGNTWFAYYGEQLSLRVFSLFPDSHSFPQFVLLGLPALFAVALLKVLNSVNVSTSQDDTLGRLIRTRANMAVLWIPVAFLIIILSGTRGIWAASVGVVIIILGVICWLYKTKAETHYKNIFKYISLYMIAFFMLFAVAYPIFVSPQFLLSKGNLGLFRERIKSIVDFGETSNAQRIEIWKASLESIKERPLLGVGIGNFPVVLDQRIFLARAGSSAHNIYLHIASEMGILALVTTIWFLWLVFKKSYENFVSDPPSPGFGEARKDLLLVTYFGATIIFVPWVLIYSLTDVALFDERAFLLFVTTVSLILAIKNPDKIGT
ncbi:MAG: O-antigen ligase family protein [bacterium]|nr:O-antigen ligase family protein [bacterium]